MAVLILISVYILSIFLCRYSFRMQYVWGHWCKESCSMSLLWFIPYINTLVGIIFFIAGYLAKNRAYKAKLHNWFTNQDL